MENESHATVVWAGTGGRAHGEIGAEGALPRPTIEVCGGHDLPRNNNVSVYTRQGCQYIIVYKMLYKLTQKVAYGRYTSAPCLRQADHRAWTTRGRG